jgi:prolyl oligopeptidase
MKAQLFLAATMVAGQLATAQEDDAYQWLEEVDGKKALEFVEAQNKRSFEKLTKVKDYADIYDQSLAIYNSSERIAFPAIYGSYVYNFWQDKEHVRGIWRRSPREAYNTGVPAWETLLDLDAMSKADSVKWVYKGVSGLYPQFNRFLVFLSKGGGDAVITREFDAVSKTFISDGFVMPEAKGSASYKDENTLIISTDFGKNSLTTSGYPRQVKLWTRGTPLSEARLIYEGQESDVSCGGYMMRDNSSSYLMVYRSMTFYTKELFVWHNDKLVKLNLPDDADNNDFLNGQLLVTPNG